MQAKLLFLHTLSPLHAGTGQGVGVIDLPIAREKATNIPYLPGSSLKGVLRDSCTDISLCKKVFGPDHRNADEHAGSLQITDMRLLLLPVRSLSGTFAWVTSPFLLERFKRDVANVPDLTPPSSSLKPSSDTACLVSDQGCELVLQLSGQPKVVLEDLDLTREFSSDVKSWATWLGGHLFPKDLYWQSALLARFCVVSDNVLTFLLMTATEITARIRLEEQSKTVARGMLWYEEALPAETVLSGLLVATSVQSNPTEVFQTIRDLTQKALQVGGNATVGRGFCQVQVA
jgi:CRISPR-associated protein Cmr4